MFSDQIEIVTAERCVDLCRSDSCKAATDVISVKVQRYVILHRKFNCRCGSPDIMIGLWRSLRHELHLGLPLWEVFSFFRWCMRINAREFQVLVQLGLKLDLTSSERVVKPLLLLHSDEGRPNDMKI